MRTRNFYVTQVLPALEAFQENYENRDLNTGADIAIAHRLAEALNSLPERIWLEEPKPIDAAGFSGGKAYRAHVRKVFPRYGYVIDFANSWKHDELGNGSRTIDSYAQIETRLAGCIYKDDKGPYLATRKLLWLRLKSGLLADVRRELLASTQYWTEKLMQFGLIDRVDPRRYSYSEDTSRVEAAQQRNIRVHGIVGEPMNSPTAVLEYDYQAGHLITVKPGTIQTIDIPFDFVIAESPFVPTIKAEGQV